MIMTNFSQRLKSVNFFQTIKFPNTDINFNNISLMFVQIFRSYFSEEIFLSSLSEWLSAQVGVFPKTETGKHKGEIKTHQQKKIKLESKEIQTETKKQIYLEGASENLMRQSPGTERK